MTHLYPSGFGRCQTCDKLLQYCICKAVEHDTTAKYASMIMIGGVWTVYDCGQGVGWFEINHQRLDERWAMWERLGGL